MGVYLQDDKLIYESPEEKLLTEFKQKSMDKLENVTLKEFVSLLGSALPAPGGGGSAALSGAQGFALSSMVCNLTVGKKKYAQYEERLKELLLVYSYCGKRMLELIDLDEENFLPLSKAYGLKSDTAEEKAYKDKVMEEALVTASLVPLEIMMLALEGLEYLQELKIMSSRLVLSDVGVAAECFRAAIEGAKLNVVINLKTMKQSKIKESIVSMMYKIQSEYPEHYRQVSSYVLDDISG